MGGMSEYSRPCILPQQHEQECSPTPPSTCEEDEMQLLRLAAWCVLTLLSCAPVAVASDKAAAADWPNPGNDKGGTRYSTLDQINRQNVTRLEVAWTYRVDDADPAKKTTIECTPLVVDGVMYITTVTTKVVALDAATGKELWRFEPYGPPYGGPSKKWQKA